MVDETHVLETPVTDTEADEAELHDPSRAEIRRLQKELNRIAGGMRQFGAMPDMSVLKPAAESYAVARILVLKGICTENEMQAEVLEAMRGMMAAALQNMEEQALKAKQPKVQPVRNPNLIVARH